jgi:hypothetical protein
MLSERYLEDRRLYVPDIEVLLFGHQPLLYQFLQRFETVLYQLCFLLAPTQILREVVAGPQRENP